MRLSPRQQELLGLLQANRGDITYCRAIGVMQPNASLDVAGRSVPRGAVVVEALERKGLVRIDRRNYTSPAYPVHVTVAGREALNG